MPDQQRSALAALGTAFSLLRNGWDITVARGFAAYAMALARGESIGAAWKQLCHKLPDET